MCQNTPHNTSESEEKATFTWRTNGSYPLDRYDYLSTSSAKNWLGGVGCLYEFLAELTYIVGI